MLKTLSDRELGSAHPLLGSTQSHSAKEAKLPRLAGNDGKIASHLTTRVRLSYSATHNLRLHVLHYRDAGLNEICTGEEAVRVPCRTTVLEHIKRTTASPSVWQPEMTAVIVDLACTLRTRRCGRKSDFVRRLILPAASKAEGLVRGTGALATSPLESGQCHKGCGICQRISRLRKSLFLTLHRCCPKCA